jgi:microcystin-dependent protein
MLVAFRTTDGTMIAPGQSWVNEPTSGIYRAGLNDFWWSVGNENIINITKDGVELAPGKVGLGFSSFMKVQDAQPSPMQLGEQWFESDTGGFYFRYVNPDATVTLVALGQTGGDFVPFAMKGQPLGVAELDGTGKVPLAQLPAVVVNPFPSGVMFDYAGGVVPAGWLPCDGAAVSRATFAALFAALGTAWGAGDGSTTFNVPDCRGRSTIGAGTGTYAATGINTDINAGTDRFTVPSNIDKWVTGTPIVYTEINGNVAPLVSTTTYWVIRQSATELSLATSLLNAQNGTVINIGVIGPNVVWTFTRTLDARTLGERGGDSQHAVTSLEQLAHNHAGSTTTGENVTVTTGNRDNNGTNPASTVTATAVAAGSVTINADGGNNAMTIQNPYAVVTKIIKT